MSNRPNTTRNGTSPNGETFNLCDELAMCLIDLPPFGKALKHPLVFSVIYDPSNAQFHNEQLEHKKRACDTALTAGDWDRYVTLHERPYRAEAFAHVADHMNDSDYWKLLAWVWIDSENISECADLWEHLLGTDRPGREQMMNDDERQVFAELPAQFPIYQGHTDRHDDGWSWTVNRDVAAFFAHRHATIQRGVAMITSGTVDLENVVAYLDGRGEQEIVVNPLHVRKKVTGRADRPEKHG